MEGGYVNEEDSDAIIGVESPGGQLKTKNGQKYVFNGRPSGIFVSKTCAIFSCIIAILIVLFSVLITYFVTVSTTTPGCLNGHSDPTVNNNHLATASMLGMPQPKSKYNNEVAPVGDIPPDNEIFGEGAKDKFPNRQLQLYDGWLPLQYNVVIEPNNQTSTSNGSVAIRVQRDIRLTSFEPIVLDINNVTITNVRVTRDAYAMNFNAIDVEFESSYNSDYTAYVITLAKTLASEKDLRLIVSMEFVSQITDTLQGVYKTSYINVDTGKREWMISTQFSPIDARRAFPCFDRPDMKANFSISIIRPTRTAMALSNMPVYNSTVIRPGFTRDDFMTTPKMPTYLLAFIVSNLVKSHYSDRDASMVPRIEIWTKPENKDMTQYAYTLVRKFLPFYEGYFGIKNRLQKIDLVTVPDFGFGAMENWGLITFRDSSLLVPEDLEKASSSEHMEFVAQIIAHELAHQWFGNLVTPKWWDDLWLKEGFACYMSYIALNRVHPEYEIMDTFTVFEFRESMSHDSDNSSHPISFNVKSTNDIRRIFDPITYSKGTILLRMLNSMVGNEAFRDASQDLLKTFAYGNADRDDLWEFMTKHGHLKKTLPDNMDIKTIMDTWINKPGYPVVNVERRGADLIVTQERYILPSRDMADDSKWIIPITYETNEVRTGHTIPSYWLMDNGHELVIKDVFTSDNNSNDIVYLNLNRQGYYRVNYDVESWLALKKQFSILPRVTRAQLLDDAFHLAQAEYLTYDIPLTFLMEIFTSIDDELLWSAAQQGLTYLIHMMSREPGYETFRAFMKFMVRPAFDQYNLQEPDNESHIQLQHRALVAKLACKFKYDRCYNIAHTKYRNWMADPNSNRITPNMKPVIYCTAMEEGSFQEWHFAYRQYNRTTSASEKEQILSSLGCTTKPWLLSKYLNMTLNSTLIMKQDGARAFRAVAENPIGFEIAFDFLQTNIKEIAEYFGDGFSTLTSMIKSITTYMSKEYHKEQLERFREKAKGLGLHSVAAAIDLAMEQVNNNIYWRNRSYYSLKSFVDIIVEDFEINIF
ncbi:aminopeptidase N isoform X2 [Stomoxys calcitrans]|uniref:Aminopeptidase n=1 Tax=Stomoxys calcitrans TaxID=35570 RepID=A0A1I8PDF6_STOCA|nr:aminopeptidase N isoform X2 [Stomoxys calcitrans]